MGQVRQGEVHPDSTTGNKATTALYALIGVFLVGCVTVLTALSGEFIYGGDPLERPTPLAVAIMLAAGGAYLVAALCAWRLNNRTWLLATSLALGFVMRAIFFFSEPILEDDHYRYLWDGGVTVSGFSPYQYTPHDVSLGVPPVPEDLAALGRASGDVLARVNHAELGTVYPPVAQGAFALAHAIRPWSITAWRFVLLAADVATIALLLALLRTLAISPLTAIIYWWNPLVIKEIYNSAHMEAIILPFVLLAAYLIMRGGYLRAAMALALGIGAKVWPLVLAPLLFREALFQGSPRWARLGGMALIFAMSLLLFAWIASPAIELGGDSGFKAYGERWQMNDALFMMIQWGADRLPVSATQSKLIARGLAAIILGIIILMCCRKAAATPKDILDRMAIIIAAMFLLSPTQFPWYYVWLVPLLVFRPQPSLLLLTALLPLYYLRFYFRSHGSVGTFDYGIVWIEYVPVWILLALEGATEWRRRRATGRATCEKVCESP